MAPIKLEENMRERLEERTIEPTVAAWDRISSKLDADQDVKKSKRVLWMSIAASFIGGILIAILFFQDNMANQEPVLVDANEKKEERVFINPDEVIVPNQGILKEEKSVIAKEEIKEKESILKTIQPLVKEEQKTPELAINKLPKTKTQEGIVEKKTSVLKEAVVLSESISKKIETTEIIKNGNLNKLITQKEDNVVAQTENSDADINAEIEVLLKNAQREIVSKQTFNQKTNTVDVNALLLDVEAEVAPTSFKNKIFDAVVEGFEKTKDAVVNRNN